VEEVDFRLRLFDLVMCQFEVLQAGAEGPCLHRLGNWLVRQLIDELEPLHRVGFIREKERLQLEQAAEPSPETGSSLLR
jgi:hypothetical protein